MRHPTHRPQADPWHQTRFSLPILLSSTLLCTAQSVSRGENAPDTQVRNVFADIKLENNKE